MLIKRELCIIFLTTEHVEVQKNEFASLLYSLVFSWIVKYTNIKLCKTEEETANFKNFRGTTTADEGDLFQLLSNCANEKLYQFTYHILITIPTNDYKTLNLEIDVLKYVENIDTLFGKNKNVI
jgi:chitin synthase